MATQIPLDSITVASPCTASWDAMSGDDRSRFCGQCSQHVYNLSDMTEEEAQSFIESREGKTCVRFFQRNDGTMMTADCPVGWRAAKRKFVLLAGAAATLFAGIFAIFTAGAVAASVQGNGNGGVQLRNPITRIKDWLFPPRRAVVMGEMCVPPVPAPPPAPLLLPPEMPDQE